MDDTTPQGRGLSSRRAARHTSAVPPASSIGRPGDPFPQWITPFLQGVTVGLLIVVLCLLISQQLN